MVWLVGAGLGDPGLLTVKALQLLRSADVVVHDHLGCEEILPLLPANVRTIDVGKIPGVRRTEQTTIQDILLREARAGNAVVRLKGGDPFVFGRGMEEIEFLRNHGIASCVVPGISSSIAAAEVAGAPVTHRKLARSFSVTTGHTVDGDPAAGGRADTQIFLMGMKNLPRIVEGLLRSGTPSHSPVAIVSHGGTYRQQVVTAPMCDIVSKVATSGIASPAVIIIGDVAEFASETGLPKNGLMVTSSRVPESAAPYLTDRPVIWRPLYDYQSISNPKQLAGVLEQSLIGDWIVFNSPPSVKGFLECLRELRIDSRRMTAKLAVIGAETAQLLEESGLFPEVTVVDGRSEGLVEAMGSDLVGAQVFVACSDQYSGSQLRILREVTGRDVTPVPVYTRLERPVGEVDWTALRTILFTSPSAVRHFVAVYTDAVLVELEALCLGESSSTLALQLGFGQVTDMTSLCNDSYHGKSTSTEEGATG